MRTCAKRPTAQKPPLHVRCVVKPEPAQAMILERLGIELPRRLRVGPTVLEGAM